MLEMRLPPFSMGIEGSDQLPKPPLVRAMRYRRCLSIVVSSQHRQRVRYNYLQAYRYSLQLIGLIARTLQHHNFGTLFDALIWGMPK